MSQAALAAAASSSSSCSATFNGTSTTTPSKLHSFLQVQNFCHQFNASFQGLSLGEAKRAVFDSFVAVAEAEKRSAKTAGASKTIEAEVDKPLGLTLGQKPGGGVTITAVDGGGNAAKSGLKVGDQVIYTSSFFGDELWPADKLGFTKTAIQAKPDSVYFVVSRGGAPVDVKRLPKRPAPPRFGRKLTETQKARATHICIDCGFIYTLQKPFEEQPDAYVCPQCRAPKKRFARYDVNTGKAIGGGLPPIGVIIGLLAGLAGVGALLVYGLQ
ncbi:uncharacterized protein Pyn_13350 [Prunus yedoensis var. nudiflora]|uniref:Rubredoxin-like domain-containing protein n=1 Tax=Prunus yedoensis var. nudiflora TaxID=2094558 RepID=A0A314UUR8_PRUYE|nr:uncharacterized protein Pyn_13350 [Prunus yedoensis var. nudiflora]